MDTKILSALAAIPVANLSHAEWITVGMALKHEGYPCSIWDDWSKNDSRYKTGVCEKRWNSFKGTSKPVTGATIIKMAEATGWRFYKDDESMDWNDVIEYDGDGFTGFNEWDPATDLKTYIQTLFDKDDIVGYVTGDVFQGSDGKWQPSKGVYTQTAGELLEAIDKYHDDLGGAIGDWNKEAGAWIRFNALDGGGVKNENVVKFKYALVESDTMSISDQDALYRKLQLPIATLVHSGKKSLHAVVKIDAKDYDEYRQRVEQLYDFLSENGCEVDKQNRNPSRLSRMPGVMRNGKRQYLVATNLGRKSWLDWLDFVEGETDQLPDIESLLNAIIENPPLPPELITGILRIGHKMLISGSSKAAKTFLLMELSVSLGGGLDWLGFKCMKGKVLYVNLEIDRPGCINRFKQIMNAMKLSQNEQVEIANNIDIWNLRGKVTPLDELAPKLIRRVKDRGYIAVIIDPIYKVITGDENNASDMGKFCNQFDKICNETGCAVIYCHHHSKGAQGMKRAMDRASGSGVFARDPDAQLDMIELELTPEMKMMYQDNGATAWRLESSLREFRNIKPVNFWFEYPLHRVDTEGVLERLGASGTPEAGRAKNKCSKTAISANDEFETAFAVLESYEDKVTIDMIADYLGLEKRTIYRRIKKLPNEFIINGGVVKRNEIVRKTKTIN